MPIIQQKVSGYVKKQKSKFLKVTSQEESS